MIRHCLGSTLIEVLISTAVFMIASMILVFMFNSGLKAWKDIDSKSSAERFVNRSLIDINAALRNSDISLIACGFNSDNGNGIIICGSNACYNEMNGSILSKEIDCKYNGNGEFFSISWPFRIVYFTYSPEPCPDCKDLGIEGLNICIHKRLIKRWFAVKPYKANVLNWPDNSTLNNIVDSYVDGVSNIPIPSYKFYEYNINDIILASNIIYFHPSVGGKSIAYDIKALKPSTMTLEQITLKEINGSIKDRGLNMNSILVSTKIYPLNNDSANSNSKSSASSDSPDLDQ